MKMSHPIIKKWFDDNSDTEVMNELQELFDHSIEDSSFERFLSRLSGVMGILDININDAFCYTHHIINYEGINIISPEWNEGTFIAETLAVNGIVFPCEYSFLYAFDYGIIFTGKCCGSLIRILEDREKEENEEENESEDES